MFHLTSIGEAQLRLTAPAGFRIANATELQVCSAGSEGNVCALLSQLGRKTALCTCVPDNNLGERILSEYRSAGVDLSTTVYSENGKAAVYFLEQTLGQKPAHVVYDRDNSAFRSLGTVDIDWNTLLDTKSVFVTGITAGLNANTNKIILDFCSLAVSKNIPIFFDVNYRSLVWPPEEAKQAMLPIAQQSEMTFCSLRDARTVFGINDEDPKVAAAKLRDLFDVPILVSTDGCRGAYLTQPNKCEFFPTEPVAVVDRPGAGDAFVGAVIEGYLSGDMEQGIRMGHIAAGIALSTFGDITQVSKAELVRDNHTDIVR